MAELKEKIIGQSDRLIGAEQKDDKNKPLDMETLEKNYRDKQDADEQMLLNMAKTNFTAAAQGRRRFDWEWLARDLFRRGYQFTKYNPMTKTIAMSIANTAKIPVNLTTAAMRVIRNQVTAFQPKWEVMPNSTEERARKQARFSGKVLDFIYITKFLKKMIKETVSQGLLFSVGGPWQIGWDETTENDDGSKGFVYIWLTDPFDFYIDPNATDGLRFSDAEFLIKAVRRPLQQVKANKNYKNTDLLTRGDRRVASSEYKQFLLQSLKYVGAYSETKETETVILKEGWFKIRDDKGKVSMRVITWVDSMFLPLRNEIVNTSDYPFRMYQADMNPLEVYGEGWARHVIVINKVINMLESSLFDYNYKVNKARLIMDKNAGVRIVTNEHGSIIEKNRGSEVTSFNPPVLPSNNESQVIRMRQYFEDISGAHDVSLGRIPVGVKSGIGIAELKQSDATNQDDLVDNLEDFLIEVAQKVLQVMAENISVPRLIKATDMGGKDDYFMVIGEKYAKNRQLGETYQVGNSEYPLVVISPKNMVKVQIGSWLAYSKQQKQQELKDLYSTGVIDQKTLLEHLEFGDIDTIIRRTQQEKLLNVRRQGQAVKQTNVSEEEIALQENQMMLEGNPEVAPMPADDHDVHISVHEQAEKNPIIEMHIELHHALKEQAMGVSNQPQQTEVPPPPTANQPQTLTSQVSPAIPQPAEETNNVPTGVPTGGIPV